MKTFKLALLMLLIFQLGNTQTINIQAESGYLGDPLNIKIKFDINGNFLPDENENIWSSSSIVIRWPNDATTGGCQDNIISQTVTSINTGNHPFHPHLRTNPPAEAAGKCYVRFLNNISTPVMQTFTNGQEIDIFYFTILESFNLNPSIIEFVTQDMLDLEMVTVPFDATNIINANSLLDDVFGQFTLIALPITLSHFQAAWNKDGYVDLFWETESELNADVFIVERSLDGRKWEAIDKLTAKGALDSRSEYRTKDLKPEAGYNYYRLKMMDLDGTYEYSPLRSVFSLVKEKGLSLYPNPVDRELFLSTDKLLEDVRVEVFSMKGGSVYFQTMDFLAQNGSTSISLPELPAGAYNVVISQKNGQVIMTDVLIKK